MGDVPDKLPAHVAIIMDGNGRWARRRNLSRTRGHSVGAESARAIVKCCVEFGIPYLTLYAFSTENWTRPASEVRFLMGQLRRFLVSERAEFVANGIRLKAIGRTAGLPAGVKKELARTEQATEGCDVLTLLLALNYGARSEIMDACAALARQVQSGRLAADQIDEEQFRRCLYAPGVPDPDLLIRTGGEMRVSNFLLWQISYCELYFSDVLWPEFRREQFLDALREYADRDRRFGAAVQRAEESDASSRRGNRAKAPG